MKERTRVAYARSAEWGDCWTFIAIERETKLVLTYAIGQRDMATSTRFLKQLDKATSWPISVEQRRPAKLYA